MLKRIVGYLQANLYMPITIIYLYLLNAKNKIIYILSRSKILQNKPLNSKNTIVFALFQKGKLRGDIRFVIEFLKEKGFDIVGVNTQKLVGDDIELFDYYVERKNYGQDFGSYKLAFTRLFKRKNYDPEKIIMLNDSIFFCRDSLDEFFNDLLDKNFDVIGATENFEVSYHLGSFCISLSNIIFKEKKFRKFWKNFKLTNIRPTNIKKGEMGLSKALKESLPSADKLHVIFGSKKILDFINENDHLLNDFNSMSRRSDFVHWKKPNGKEVINYVLQRLTSRSQLSASGFLADEWSDSDIEFDFDMNIDLDVGSDEYGYVDGYDGFKSFFEKYQINVPEKDLKAAIQVTILNSFREGSQIHQNFIWNYCMGCPILKNDGVYRGMWNMEDVINLKKYMEAEDFKEFSKILLSRQYGMTTLKGWRLYAFSEGYI
tara:strand:- start:1642 stop:2934 length:1293 start_codon:yes stop_codon:yes gene_type:complete